MSNKIVEFKTYQEFYPYYRQEHSNVTCRRLHIIGTSLSLVSFAIILFAMAWKYIWFPLVIGYGLAWVGHFFFEKNKPATFKYPLYSFRGDLDMCWAFWSGNEPF
mmetsp:Transcript_13252/g.19973  ORF Transcript_13252/g.19973 Transcript_13252/m.19973 type:complete len:105 (-) Transcript_13252:128-442(-)